MEVNISPIITLKYKKVISNKSPESNYTYRIRIDTPPSSPCTIDDDIDINQIVRKWYEIMHTISSFNEPVSNNTVTYSLLNDGSLEVMNEAVQYNHYIRTIGYGSIENNNLKLSYDMSIIKHDDDYNYIILSSPNHKRITILSKTKYIDEDIYKNILQWLNDHDYNTNKLIQVKHYTRQV